MHIIVLFKCILVYYTTGLSFHTLDSFPTPCNFYVPFICPLPLSFPTRRVTAVLRVSKDRNHQPGSNSFCFRSRSKSGNSNQDYKQGGSVVASCKVGQCFPFVRWGSGSQLKGGAVLPNCKVGQCFPFVRWGIGSHL